MKRYFYILFIASYVLFESCGPETSCSCEIITDIPEDMKPYISFSEGDYWIYRLRENGDILDTLTCSNYRIIEQGCDRENSFSINADNCSKIYKMNLEHSNKEMFPNYDSQSSSGGYEECVVEQIFDVTRYTVERNIPYKSHSGDHFHIPNYDPGIYYGPSSNVYTALLVDSIYISDTMYMDVVLSFQENYFSELIDSMYFKADIGWLGYKDKPGHTWELIEYSIQ